MFHKFLGDREDRLQKERQDYLTASLRYNELFKSVELIRYELNLLSKKESNLNLVEKEINALMKDREKEILDYLAKGFLYKEIAAELFISKETVKKHIHNIYEKLQVQTRTEALNKAFQR